MPVKYIIYMYRETRYSLNYKMQVNICIIKLNNDDKILVAEITSTRSIEFRHIAASHV